MHLDTIIDNARITTVDPERPQARSLGILNHRIVGFDEDLDGLTATTRVDLAGAAVVPGFNDAHFHFSLVGLGMTQLDLSPAKVSSLEQLYRAVEKFSATLPVDSWVRGQGYDQTKIGGQHPDRQVLDQIAGGRPVYLQHNSHHMAVASTAALHRCGYPDPAALEAPPGGSLGYDASGRFTGLLQEQAMRLVTDHLRPVPQEDLVKGLSAASRWCLQHGITSATEPGIGGLTIGHGPADLQAFQAAADLGLLQTRLTVMPYIDALHALADDQDDGWGLDLGLRTGLGNEWLRIGPVKILSDGSLIGRTAALCCDYSDAPGNSGYLQWDEGALHDLIVTAHSHDWQVAVHAIGDYALDVALTALEAGHRKHPRPQARHRIEHAALTSETQVARIARGGFLPVSQGRFISELGDGIVAALGEHRLGNVYRMRSFINAGIELPGWTDAPVVPGEPLRSIHDMVNRLSESGVPIGASESLRGLSD